MGKMLITTLGLKVVTSAQVLLGYSYLDVNKVITIAVTVHLSNSFPLEPDDLVSLASCRDLETKNNDT